MLRMLSDVGETMSALKVDDALQAIATLQQENTKLLVALIDLHRHTTAYLTAGAKSAIGRRSR